MTAAVKRADVKTQSAIARRDAQAGVSSCGEAGYGLTTSGCLSISPMLMEKYRIARARLARSRVRRAHPENRPLWFVDAEKDQDDMKSTAP